MLCAGAVLAGTAAYTYDQAGRLILVQYESGPNVRFDYDLNGNLLARTTSPAKPGDVYQDNAVNLADVIRALQVDVGQTPQGVYSNGDVNGDFQVGQAEALFVIQVLGAGR